MVPRLLKSYNYIVCRDMYELFLEFKEQQLNRSSEENAKLRNALSTLVHENKALKQKIALESKQSKHKALSQTSLGFVQHKHHSTESEKSTTDGFVVVEDDNNQ